MPAQLGLADASVSEMRGRIDRYGADLGSLARLYPIEYSPNRRGRMAQHLQQTLAELLELEPEFAGFEQAAKLDYILFKNHLTLELRKLEAAAVKAEQIAELLPFAPAIIALEEARRLLQPQDAKACAGQVAAVPDSIGEITARLTAEGAAASGARDVKAQIRGRRAAATAEALARHLREWSEHYIGWDPEFSWWLKAPVAAALGALEGYAWFLRETLVGYGEGEEEPVIGDPIGREVRRVPPPPPGCR